ncbi:MAG TPA: bifunctional shikimate kinase/3-dehydroquinate synthase [Gaiellaceae bacterium]|nr:bifunctional shikimate kinase/3-dehydroquinate synthase [Gaiellaceae bacterium]
MGAGKTTVGAEVARRLGRPFFDVDEEVERAKGPIWELFAREGEAAFRELEARFLREVCSRRQPAVVAVGGGAVETRRLLEELDALIVHLQVDVETAWRRVAGSRRPLAQDEMEFRRRYELRAPLYSRVADAAATDADDVVLAAGGVHVSAGSLEHLDGLLPGDEPVALVADEHVAGLYGARAERALADRRASTHVVPRGETAKTLATCERLWQELRLERGGMLVAFGGGCTSDVAGFVAATYLRGIAWAAVPTTLVAQVDAAIGGKTAIDLPQGKNLVGAFHWPERTVIDPRLLRSLPDSERRAGMAEVVKTGLLAGEPMWELPDAELVRRSALYKTAVCLRDPSDRGERSVLNLGHTFAHALEAGAGYQQVTHGEAVALGLSAALRLSVEHLGLDRTVADDVEAVLAPQPVRVDLERAWAALRRDKKAKGGRPRLVLLEAPGKPVRGVELPDDHVRAALASLVVSP